MTPSDDLEFGETPYDAREEVATEGDDIPEELQTVFRDAVQEAMDYVDEDVADEQAEATEYYRGEPFGNEREGRSQYVSRDVHDAIAAIMPELMRVFTGAEHVVEFRPSGPDDEAYAAQATDAIRHIFEKENDGFGVIYNALKDGLIRKVGVGMWWHEKDEKVTESDYTVDEEGLISLLNEDGAELLKSKTSTGEDGLPVHEVTVRHTRSKHCFKVDALPPEELIVGRTTRRPDGVSGLIGRRRVLTVSELVRMGYDEEMVLEHATGSNELEHNELAVVRDEETESSDRPDDEAKEVLYVEAFVLYDLNEDGVHELLRVCSIGSALNVVKAVPVEDLNMAVWCPDPEPHRVIGESFADKLISIQELKSDIWRGVVDSLAEAIVPRTEVVEGRVRMEDVLNNETGAPIRVREPGMVRSLSQPFVGQAAFPFLEIIDTVRDQRVGAMRAADGLSAETMQSSTRMAVAATISGSKKHTELVARLFAAQFLRPVFRGLLKLFVQHQDKARVMRLRGQWVSVDPRAWNADMDVDVDVALAMTTVEERLATLEKILAKQEAILQTLGPQNPLVTMAQYSETLRRAVELGGYRNVDSFFNRVDPNWAPPAAAEPPPDPALLLAQAQIKVMEQELELKREKQQHDMDLERDKLAQEREIKFKEIEARYGAQVEAEKARLSVEQQANNQQAVLGAAQIAMPPPAEPAQPQPATPGAPEGPAQ